MKPTRLRTLSLVTLVIFLNQLFFPTISWALSGGPSQPEVHGFEPAGSNQMVDLFSGDFTYNLPLLDVGGYPINMAYHSGVGMEDEASWVGLGWSLTPGSINRSMRGLPDDFKGDMVKTEQNMLGNSTVGVSAQLPLELIGIQLPVTVNAGVYENSYKGVGTTFGMAANVNIPMTPVNVSASLGIDSKGGSDLDVGLSFDVLHKKSVNESKNGKTTVTSVGSLSPRLNIGVNSQNGLKYLSFGTSGGFSQKTETKNKDPKKNKSSSASRSMGATSNIPVNYNSYTPSTGMSMYNANVSLNIAVGFEAWGTHPQFEASGYISKQWVAETEFQNESYGYLYAEEGENRGGTALMDFNREADYAYTEGITNLQMTNMTYDIFNVSGQGTGGMFRPMRNDMPIVGDIQTFNRTDLDRSVALEIGTGSTARYGGNAKSAGAESTNGYWPSSFGNNLESAAGYSDKAEHDLFYENVYMLNGGEMTPIDDTIFRSRGGYDPVRVEVIEANKEFSTLPIFKTKEDKSQLILMDQFLERRQYKRRPRSNTIVWRTNEEADKYGFRKNNDHFSEFKTNKEYLHDKTRKAHRKLWGNRTGVENPKGHHIGEVVVSRPDGMRYVYGIPAYNKKQVDVAFSIADKGLVSCDDDGLVTYQDANASIDNPDGRDKYFKKTTTPAYSHSYLLTAVLSPDYVDITGDGISSDDYGSAVKLNYKKQIDNFGWRAPIQKDKARYSEGLKNLDYDAKASYTYGQKEIWYLHSVESKTHIAEFYTSARNDALGVSDEKGTLAVNDTLRLQKLDSILLFSKIDRIDNIDWHDKYHQTAPDEAIKKVHFSYDYSLCEKVPNQVNSGDGKLTLKSVRFSHGRSKKGMLSPYKFTYGHNPDYDMNNMDRWASYKENDCEQPSKDFPYTPQTSVSDLNAEAWHMTQIDLPTGGTIEVDYEADDYAYVMDKRAMQMLTVAGVGKTSLFDPELSGASNDLYNENPQYFVYVKLPETVEDATELSKRYMPEDSLLYHKFNIYIKGKNEPELISGYAKIEQMGLVLGHPDYAYIQLKGEDYPNGDAINWANPITKNAWKFIHDNMGEKIYDKSPSTGTDEERIDDLIAYFKDITSLFTGKYARMRSDGFAQYCIPDQSVVRLNSPTGSKKGGGTRVKQITMRDHWAPTSAYTDEGRYGTVYEYTRKNPDKGHPSSIISSGVATYEPMVGADENPFKVPAYYNIYRNPKLKFLGGEERYFEGPLGESFFPGGSVGYSEVTVRSLATTENRGTGTGYSINRFFTARDFPVKVDFTTIKTDKVQRSGFSRQVLKSTDDRLVASQGYLIKLNNMHGKQRATWSFDEAGNRISGTQYNYKHAGNELNNGVTTLAPDGKLVKKIIGQTDDIVMDTRMVKNEHWVSTTAGNFDFFTVGAIPVPVLTGFKSYASNKNSLKTVSVTKVIQQYGILESVTAHDEQSQVTTTNLLWDEGTGDVLLTRTENEYQDPLFNMRYPAYYAYPDMGHEYKNVGLVFKQAYINDGVFTLGSGADASKYFTKGDRIIATSQTVGSRDTTLFKSLSSKLTYPEFYVKGIKDDKVFLITPSGKAASGRYRQLKIVESGKSNQLTESVTSVTFGKQHEPDLSASQLTLTDTVMQFSVSEYSDEWATYCDQSPHYDCFLDTGVGIPIQNIFNSMASAGELLTSSVTSPYGYGSNNKVWNTKFSRFSKRHTSYNPCTSVGCSYLSVYDTVYLYDVQYPNGKRTSIQYVGYPGRNELSKYSWYKEISRMDAGRRKGTCCDWDTMYADTISFNGLDSVRFQDTMRLVYQFKFGIIPTTDFSIQGENFCPFYFYELEEGGAPDLLQADSFKNIRIYPQDQSDVTTFQIDVYFGAVKYRFGGNSGPCYPIRTCDKLCELITGEVLNPYRRAIKGIWRKTKDYVYHTDRSQSLYASSSTENTNIRDDGHFVVDQFWEFGAEGMERDLVENHKWIAPSVVKHVSPHGNELEIEDALGRSSTEIYGYDRKLVVAVANNAAHNNIGFDGFEDYDFPYYLDCRKESHWAFSEYYDLPPKAPAIQRVPFLSYFPRDSLKAFIRFDQSHTGRASLYVPGGSKHTSNDWLKSTDTTTFNWHEMEVYKLEPNLCIGTFTPERELTYTISGWIMESDSGITEYPSNYDDGYVSVKSDSTSFIHKFYPKGPIIDGWQRFSGEFSIPADSGATALIIEAHGGPISKGGVFYDDVRIQPYNSSMKSYVYDPLTLRMTAELDANNFATFYEYDQEGRLLRIKKETEHGVVTLQESRYGTPKKD